MKCPPQKGGSFGEYAISHKADSSFFEKKREWSPRKDRILGAYLAAYLPKMSTQRRPVLIVDAFAGPGKFGDGEPGSPLIICGAIRDATSRGRPLRVPVRMVAVEAEAALCARLAELLAPFDFAEAVNTSFAAYLPEIIECARRENVFLYVDPFTVEGLEWYAMDQLFSKIRERISIEVLLNFNAASFVRRGLAALKLSHPDSDPEIEDLESIDAEPADPPSLEKLNLVVGGDSWQKLLRAAPSYTEQVAGIAAAFCECLRRRFKEVCFHAVRAKPHHTVAKYYLIFGSRHPHALRLMNDEMVKSQAALAEMAIPKEPTLFETRSEELVPDLSHLPSTILELASTPRQRGELIVEVIRADFGRCLSAQVRGAIQKLLKSRDLESATGKSSINDRVQIWRRR